VNKVACYIELRLRGLCHSCFRILGEYYLCVREMLNGMVIIVDNNRVSECL